MEAKAKLFGHSIHQMLIVFPLGLLGTGVLFDVVHFIAPQQSFAAVAYWMMVAGVVGGLIAAPFGLADWISIPSGTRARNVGAAHGIGNVLVLGLFAASVWLRGGEENPPPTFAYVCSFLGLGVALFTGWLGGELVTRYAVGVHDGAGVDAPRLRPR